MLQRFIDCAEHYSAKQLIRVCSDNPFLQFGQVSHYINELSNGADYISFATLMEPLPSELTGVCL